MLLLFMLNILTSPIAFSTRPKKANVMGLKRLDVFVLVNLEVNISIRSMYLIIDKYSNRCLRLFIIYVFSSE